MKLGRYEVVRELGKGAMGIVYLAKDPLIGRLVALKTIRPVAHADDDEAREFQQRFVREAQAAGILNHPAIVTVHDIGQDENGLSFIAMEYVEGHNLKEVLAQGRPLSFDQIGDIISQIAEGLDFAHSKGIVHRDVKPANIILLEGNRAKITDFGIAKIASSGNLTSTGQFLGTPNYMAPEQIKGSPVDGRTDIFSLGICFYECLTRRKPFGGDSLTSISYKIVHESFAPLQEVNPQIPEGYNEIVAMCLAKEPGRRYQRGKDLANAIRAVLRGDKPRPADPALEEATMVTDRGHIPTIELPFPEASGEHAEAYSATTAAAAAAMEANAAIPEAGGTTKPRAQRQAKIATPRVVRRTLDGVRAYPLWRRSLPAALFFGIIAVALGVVVISAATIRKQTPAIPKVDTFMESRVAKQRQLRIEANQLIRDGRLIDAYAKYEELNKLAPSSPSVNSRMQQLSRIREQERISRAQLDEAQRLFEEGVALFNSQNFAGSIEIFQKSFHLNPNSDETARYLKLAQQEDQRVRDERLAAIRPKTTTKTPATAAPPLKPVQAAVTPAQPAAPAQFTTFFNSPVNDGFIVVKVGADIVAQENLFTEVRRVFRRKLPRQVNVTTSFPAKNADVQVSIVIPSLQISEHKTFRGNFAPGSTHRLVVGFDPKTKQFSYQFE